MSSSLLYCPYFFLYLCRIIENIVIMTKANKVLFITQEITPYVSESEMSLVGRNLPQAIQEKGREIRTFMPKWGNINERRNQLHEVIRLSGMNLIIDDTDHPLIIKVASIQSARMQVYFIDNDDYFQNRLQVVDENGVEYEDNDARASFLCTRCIGNSQETALVSGRHPLPRLDDCISTAVYQESV